MKKGVLFMFMISAVFTAATAQMQERKVRLNVEINQFITGSGFATGTELYAKLLSENIRTLAFGLFYDAEYQKITGISIHHEVMLWRKFAMKNPWKPHMFYNLIYRKTTIPEVGTDLLLNGDLETYTSMEHHLGMGLKYTFIKNFYLDFDIGYGAYLGSIKKPGTADPVTGEVRGSNGFGMIAQIGFGCQIF